MSVKKKKAIIIGSGVSGLSAAKTLVESGFDVEIFEARADHGGRLLKNESFGGFPIDIGGEEIHKVQSPYHYLAETTGAQLKPDDEYHHYFEDIEGEQLLEREEFFKKYEKEHHYDDIITNIDKQDDSQSLLDYFKSKNLPQPFFSFYENFWGVENGGSLHEISVKAFGEYQAHRKNDHDVNLITSNMSQFDIFERAFSSVFHLIKYSTPIKEIHYSSQSSLSDSAVSIIDAHGNLHEGDYLIVTVPISQLQNNSIKFIPELPKRKQDAINKMKLGKGGKIHLKFKNNFWPENTRNIFLRSKISFVWNLCHRKKGEVESRTNVLAGLIGGDVMKEMQDPVQRQVLVDELLDKMTRVFNYPRLREELVEIMWSDFTKVDYIEGTYTIPSINLGDSRLVYQEPIDDILFFAGEASHPTEAMTIHGAYETGLRDAQRIIQLAGIIQPSL